ncbi:putative glutamate--cysteine ligase 2-3 [Catellatospora sp. TT07R-123]|uniref:carboxylate-amine ligase n=1 Tax=Catellatospora sp. TT07R-123 TaxID=2733863 RepID=UPI001B267D55|nr:glutamate--cysteine ligase [Catellatospora sp. TT07R-123]GHJ45563.1 putative glutamate--cysteine ligase 2-3 [Catellatospora sp. TT07R-123]
MGTGNAPRFGVEEEFLVVDAQTRAPVPRAQELIDAAKPRLDGRVSGEITTWQLETRTHPCTSAAEVLAQLREARTEVGKQAHELGVRLIASGSPVLGAAVPPPMTQGPRQTLGQQTFRGLHDELAICALHVHVEMPDRDHAVRVSNLLRPYLPVLLTLTANSPYWDGRDSGYASWRTMTWPRWPVAGPPPEFASAEHYDEVVGTLLAAGALVDRGTVFWDVRPSASHPTLEVRVADVPITAEESALYAALVRALVAHLSARLDAGEASPQIPGELMRTAYWRAARDGLCGDGVDLRTGVLTPAFALLDRMVDEIGPVLDANGDAGAVAGWLASLRHGGIGAQRQRAAARRNGRLADVVDYLAEQTIA